MRKPKLITHCGVSKPVSAWAAEIGCATVTLYKDVALHGAGAIAYRLRRMAAPSQSKAGKVVLVEPDGTRLPLLEAVCKYNVSESVMRRRIQAGLPFDQIISAISPVDNAIADRNQLAYDLLVKLADKGNKTAIQLMAIINERTTPEHH